jgi:hypothetical protein
MVIAVAGLVLAAAGAAAAVSEITPSLTSAASPGERFAAIATGSYRPGDSVRSKEAFLVDCLDLPKDLVGRVQPRTRREQFAGTCRAVAQAALATMPTYSLAWLVVADSSVTLDHAEGFRAALLASARTAPDVHWLAERRSALAAAHLDLLDDAGQAAWRRDLATLTTSYPGLDVLAARYARGGVDREAIVDTLEAAPPDRRRAFLQRVRQRTGSAS